MKNLSRTYTIIDFEQSLLLIVKTFISVKFSRYKRIKNRHCPRYIIKSVNNDIEVQSH